MSHAAIIACTSACVRARIAPVVADLEALDAKMEADTAAAAERLSILWLVYAPPAGRA